MMLVVTCFPKWLLSSRVRGRNWPYVVAQIWLADPLSVPDSCCWANFCFSFLCWWKVHQCHIFCWEVYRLKSSYLTQPVQKKPQTFSQSLVLLIRTGYGFLANMAELYVSHPPTLPGVTKVPLLDRYCNAAYGQGTEHEARKLAVS